MAKKTIEAELCDICEIKPERTLEYVKVNTCEVCERDMCRNDHVGDTYRTTQHMRTPLERVICKECWALLEYNGYKSKTTPLPKGNIDFHASGSTMAINIAEFREHVESTAKEYAQDSVVRVLKAIRTGRQEKIDFEKLRKDAQSKQESEIQDLLNKKYNEARQAQHPLN